MTGLEWFSPHYGDGRIRILGDLGRNSLHVIENETKHLRQVPCIGTGCKLCGIGHQPVLRQLYSIIDRTDDRIKFFSMGEGLRRKMDDAVRRAPFKNKTLSRFDIRLVRNGQGRFMSYDVLVYPPKRLKTSEYERGLLLMAALVAKHRPSGEI